MATPDMRRLPSEITPIRDDQSRMVRSRAAMRLLSAERSEEIFPVLLEEIVSLGFARAMVLAVDFESSEIKPNAALNCANSLLKAAHTSLWAVDNPVVAALHAGVPAVVQAPSLAQGQWYAHPIVYRNRHMCWEAERDRRNDCLAVLNDKGRRKLHLQDQVCASCEMRAYAAI